MPPPDITRESTHTTLSPRDRQSVPTCGECGNPLERDIFFGDLRFYVCRPCGVWAVPFPPRTG